MAGQQSVDTKEDQALQELQRMPTPPALASTPMRRCSSHYLLAQGSRELWLVDPKDVLVGKSVGEGASAVVWKGIWRRTNVAVKKWKGTESKNVGERDALLSEINVLRTLRHPNIVMFMGAVISDNSLFVLLEWMHGGSLQELLFSIRGRPLPLPQTLQIAHDTLVGLHFLHACSPPIMHRDLKPANILLGHNGEAKIADFGLSRFETTISTHSIMNSPIVHTSRGKRRSLVGTSRYIAPEVANGRRHKDVSDIWAFGLILHYMATGKHPFHRMTIKQWEDTIRDFHQYEMDPYIVKTGLYDIVAWCLDRNLRNRPSSGDAIEAISSVRNALHPINCCVSFGGIFGLGFGPQRVKLARENSSDGALFDLMEGRTRGLDEVEPAEEDHGSAAAAEELEMGADDLPEPSGSGAPIVVPTPRRGDWSASSPSSSDDGSDEAPWSKTPADEEQRRLVNTNGEGPSGE